MAPEAAPHHPFRVTRRSDVTGRPLTRSQQRILAALVHLCPRSGCETTARDVAKAAGSKHGAVVIVLQSLAELRFVTCFDEDDDQPTTWTPTMSGRARARAAASNRRAVLDGIA
jgi:DNA-binding MarR family transcriptional regulator